MLARPRAPGFFEYGPLRFDPPFPPHLPAYSLWALLDVFVLDMRSYRAANNFNRQTVESPETVYFGADQFGWLQKELKNSQALWKIIATDMPLGIVVPDGVDPGDEPVREPFQWRWTLRSGANSKLRVF